MTPIETIHLQGALSASTVWPRVAHEVQGWLQGRGLAARDAVLLLPFAALLAPARAALAALGGWQPRVETTLTLAASLGPPPAAAAGSCRGDPVGDRLAAAALMRRQTWGAAWERRDAAGFARAVALVVDAAQALREAAITRHPDARAVFWQTARELCGAGGGPGDAERLLLRTALEWAAASDEAATDRLFALQPAAWITVQLGGPDALAEGLLDAADRPALRLVADPPAAEPFAAVAASAALERFVCDDFEAEARAAAATVLEAVDAGRVPVGLVALDRALLRRVRALLERTGLPLHDETGWLLATTAPATRVVALLRAAAADAGADARLDWLKVWPPAGAGARDALEALWRGRQFVPLKEAAEQLWAEAQRHLAPLAQAGSIPLAAWLDLLQGQLARDGSFDALASDPAGPQVIAALGLGGQAAWRESAADWRLDLAGFTAWVQATLEVAPYLPPAAPGAPVVLTPLARAFGRGFAHIVLPGADASHLGATEPTPSLIGPGPARALGLAHGEQRRLRQRLALAQVLQAPRVTLLRRRLDDDEPLADSPDVEWLLIERARAGGPPVPALAPPLHLETRAVASRPRPLPSAADALPARLSATQLQALRDCPYRFYARAVLRLYEDDELDVALAKRDYGEWLHDVLHRFHRDRQSPGSSARPALEQLRAVADAVTHERGIDPGELLPFRASFERFAPAYVAWLAERDAAGWRWRAGETDHTLEPEAPGGLVLRGRLDRIDDGPAGRVQVLDYKTGSAQGLKEKARQPLEDVQLAFYAALLGAGDDGDGDGGVDAAFLAVDGSSAPELVPQRDAATVAQVLLHGLAGEWRRLREGAPLPALGEGPVCEFCEARGLCRRDHWAPT